MRKSNVPSAIGLIILAAGASTRMGTPKQLLTYKNDTLIQTAVKTALRSKGFPVVVVLGAHKELMKAELSNFPVFTADNPDWEEGMGASIRTGLEMVCQVHPLVEAVVVMLCDQPFVSATLINQLIDQYKSTGAAIVASVYENAVGVPALFSQKLFAELRALQGNEGARKLIKEHQAEVLPVPFPAGSIDIDTPEDYLRLQTTSYVNVDE
jgi:molybdenum cofactor cytidylyltransferase